MMVPNPPTPLANFLAQKLSLKRMGSPVAASPRKVVNRTACIYLCARVKRMKNRSPAWLGALLISCLRSALLASLCRPCFDLLVSRADQPQYGVNHEERQYPCQQQIHEQADKVKGRIQLAIVRVGVWLILHEAGVGARVALAAGGHQVGRSNRRAGGGGRQYIMRSVAVPAARGLHVAAQRAQLRVECVPVSGQLVLVARTADRRGLHTD